MSERGRRESCNRSTDGKGGSSGEVERAKRNEWEEVKTARVRGAEGEWAISSRCFQATAGVPAREALIGVGIRGRRLGTTVGPFEKDQSSIRPEEGRTMVRSFSDTHFAEAAVARRT